MLVLDAVLDVCVLVLAQLKVKRSDSNLIIIPVYCSTEAGKLWEVWL